MCHVTEMRKGKGEDRAELDMIGVKRGGGRARREKGGRKGYDRGREGV